MTVKPPPWIRLVPPDPDPVEFPFVPLACDLRDMAVCRSCDVIDCPRFRQPKPTCPT